jgi:hypothetical protein
MIILLNRLIHYSLFIIHYSLFILAFTTLQAAELPSTSFAIGKYEANNGTGTYGNNLNINRILTIPDAQALEVTVEGETEEGYDVLTISDHDRKNLRRFSGPINDKFSVKGATIHLTFASDGRTTKNGVIIKIASSSLFNELKTRLADATNKVLKEGTKYANAKISKKLGDFKRLHDQVENQAIDNVMEKAIAELVAITNIYKEIASMSEKITTIHQTQFKIIEDLKTETLDNIEKLKREQSKYSDLLSSAQTKLNDDSLSAVAKQKEKFSVGVYNRILEKMKKQQENWELLGKTQQLLEGKLKEHSEKVGLLLYFVGINAQLYEQAANVALMRKARLTELNDLTNLSELQKIVADIEKKEKEIRELLEKIQKTSFEQ